MWPKRKKERVKPKDLEQIENRLDAVENRMQLLEGQVSVIRRES